MIVAPTTRAARGAFLSAPPPAPGGRCHPNVRSAPATTPPRRDDAPQRPPTGRVGRRASAGRIHQDPAPGCVNHGLQPCTRGRSNVRPRPAPTGGGLPPAPSLRNSGPVAPAPGRRPAHQGAHRRFEAGGGGTTPTRPPEPGFLHRGRRLRCWATHSAPRRHRGRPGQANIPTDTEREGAPDDHPGTRTPEAPRGHPDRPGRHPASDAHTSRPSTHQPRRMATPRLRAADARPSHPPMGRHARTETWSAMSRSWNTRRHGGENPYGNAYRRDRRLAHKILPAFCAACGRVDQPLEADHVPGIAEYQRRCGELPPAGLRADEIERWYRLLCPECHRERTAQQRAEGQRAAAAARAAEKEARRPKHPRSALGAGAQPADLGVWPRVRPPKGGEGPDQGEGGSEADIVPAGKPGSASPHGETRESTERGL